LLQQKVSVLRLTLSWIVKRFTRVWLTGDKVRGLVLQQEQAYLFPCSDTGPGLVSMTLVRSKGWLEQAAAPGRAERF
jgi:hypothetical protein